MSLTADLNHKNAFVPVYRNPYANIPGTEPLRKKHATLSEKVSRISEGTLGYFPLDLQYHMLSFFDIPTLAKFSLTSTEANRMVPDSKIWESIAIQINCPINKVSPISIYKQVLHFIAKIQKRASEVKDRPEEITAMLKGPSLEEINQIQDWLQAEKTLAKWGNLVTAINKEMPSLNLEGPGNLTDLKTSLTRISKAKKYVEWFETNQNFLKARDTLTVWETLADTLDLEGPNLANFNNQQSVIDEAQEFNHWCNDNEDELGDIQALNFWSDYLTSLPDGFGKLIGLRELILKDCLLSSLPDDFGNLVSLRQLDLDNNNLIYLPDSFGNFTRLKQLDLRNNHLSSLPNSFGNLARLKQLDLRNNHLSSLPGSFGNLAQLNELHLENNLLSSLPDSFCKLDQLKQLHLENNHLSSLPDDFGHFLRLVWLYLENNNLSSLPDSFGNLLSRLDQFHLENNPLSNYPQAGLYLKPHKGKISLITASVGFSSALYYREGLMNAVAYAVDYLKNTML